MDSDSEGGEVPDTLQQPEKKKARTQRSSTSAQVLSKLSLGARSMSPVSISQFGIKAECSLSLHAGSLPQRRVEVSVVMDKPPSKPTASSSQQGGAAVGLPKGKQQLANMMSMCS